MEKKLWSRVILLLLVISLGINLYMWNQIEDLQKQIARMNASNATQAGSNVIGAMNSVTGLLEGRESKGFQYGRGMSELYNASTRFGNMMGSYMMGSSSWRKVRSGTDDSLVILREIYDQSQGKETFTDLQKEKLQAVKTYLTILIETLQKSSPNNGVTDEAEFQKAARAAEELSGKIVQWRTETTKPPASQ